VSRLQGDVAMAAGGGLCGDGAKRRSGPKADAGTLETSLDKAVESSLLTSTSYRLPSPISSSLSTFLLLSSIWAFVVQLVII
jgi:hypothetical protein